MRYGSICSGIEAATVAWHGLGWEPAFFSEIDNFPRAALQHHYPNVPLHGDFTTINGDEYGHIDLLVGGTPCQDFSIAGLRAGFAGERGNLTLEFARLVDRMRPRWVVWENVPGVLSIDGGRAFGAFLGALAEIGYGFAYRILDAQYCGVPQRRRRVFVVGYLGDWRRAAAVLFERESLLGHPAPRREAGEGTAAGTAQRPNGGGDSGLIPEVCPTLVANGNKTGGNRPSGTDGDTVTSLIVMASGQSNVPVFENDQCPAPAIAFSIMPMNSGKDYKARETDIAQPIMAGGPVGGNQGGDFIVEPVLPIHFQGRGSNIDVGQDVAGSSRSYVAAAFTTKLHNTKSNNAGKIFEERTTALDANSPPPALLTAMQVRRLTPRECERLQGFPDDYTLVPYRGKPAADGNRYKALGNSMAVPVMRWIGERIELIEALTKRIG